MPELKLAACLIVRDSEKTLPEAIASIAEHVDEIVVCDTGSTDGTLEWIAERNRLAGDVAPIRVVHFEWVEDFGAARQASFDAVSDDVTHIVWMDDDDEIEGAENLRAIAAQIPPNVAGTVCYYDYSRDETGATNCELWRERILRRDAGYQWRGAVHETLVPPDGSTPLYTVTPKEIIRWVHHRERAGERYLPERNLRILRAEAKRADDAGERVDARTLAYLATENMARANWPEAIAYAVEYLKSPGGWSDERMQMAHKLATALRYSGQLHASIETEFEALRERDDWAETAVGLAESFSLLGQWDRVERWARRALELGKPQSVLILNPLEFTILPLYRLAQAFMARSAWSEAEKAVGQALALQPRNPMILELRGALEQARGEHKLVTGTLELREFLCRHDENLKALQVLESAPYQIAEHPAIVQALRDQRKMIGHARDEQAYDGFYRHDDKTSTVPDESIATIGEFLPRAARLLEGLRNQAKILGRRPYVLDLGCNDWWLGQYLWDHGFSCHGIELNEQAYAIAQKRVDAIGTKIPTDGPRLPRVVHGNLFDAPKHWGAGKNGFDAISLFEVIEHVPDPNAVLELCERMLKPGGVVYLTTPNGSYDQGNTPGALDPTRKQHLRAIPMGELARMIAPRGIVEALEEHHEGRVAFGAYTPMRKRGRIVLHGGQSVEPWSPAQAKQGGIGGSETALVQIATRLAQRQWNVEVYSDAEPGLWGGAMWRPRHLWDPSEYADATIISRTPAAFDEEINSPVRALWCHDQAYPDMTPRRAENLTHLIVLSEWQAQWASKIYPDVDPEKHVLLRNGISSVPASVPVFADRKPVVAYSSAPDRGLKVLLELWPRIREAVPDAELRIFYGWDVFDRVAMWNPGLQGYKAELLAQMAALGGEAGGIVWRGRIGQDELAHEFEHARVLGYPASFRETSCITAMECRAAGLPIVTSRLAALTHTVGKHGILIDIPGDDDSPGMNANEEAVASGPYGERFVAEVTRLLADEAYWTRWSAKGRQGSKALTWEARIPEWERLVMSGVRAKRKAAA